MIRSWEIPEFVIYRDVALALHDVQREISAKQHAKDIVARKIMPAIIEKRDRLAAEVARLKIAADAAERAALERITAPTVVFQSHFTRTTPLWCEADGLDIPAFLRRQGS
jgi:hypothetical protein